jgi:hypothetical protein
MIQPVVLCIVALMALLSCSSGGEGGGTLPQPLSERYPIDGVVDFSAFPNVQQKTMDFISLVTGTVVKSTTLKWVVLNDDRNVYIALEWTDDTYDHTYDISQGPVDFDGVKLLFDNDGDDVIQAGEDERIVIAASVGSLYIDQHASSGDETDAVGDGLAKLRYDAATQTYQAEFLFPLQADVNGQDANLTAATRYSILLIDHLVLVPPMSGNVAGGAYGPGTASSGWPVLPLVAAGKHAHAEVPSGLSGLVAFISDHEEPNGEVYTFNPATGVVTRVTNTSLYKENVSLSHNRTRVAFHGTPNRTDYAMYEIYTVDVDGQNLARITNNAELDGHPGWSPDDSKIVYVKYPASKPGKASIIIANADGSNPVELTPANEDDNDPDFLPDGRIVFKTLRGSTSPLTRIALMDANGGNVQYLTTPVNIGAGVSDHDPIGNNTVAVFERFLKNTDYATDVESMFTPWDIVEARLDALGERTLLHNGWINWLPVFDPTGQYLVYLRTVGYTSAEIMTRDGRELGRLIPGYTRLRYIDWK